MVVLSVSICTKQGKNLVARQFVDISRVRIEGLLGAFTKLMGTGGKQHTYIETDSVRYLYLPVEQLYIVMITTKNSNIVEDLDTLHLLAKLIPEYCGGVDEAAVSKNAFEVVFAFDEVITMGYKEKTSIQVIRSLTDMDSHEERIQEMIMKNKEKEAKMLAKKKQKEIEEMKREGRGSGFGGGGFGKDTTGGAYASPMPSSSSSSSLSGSGAGASSSSSSPSAAASLSSHKTTEAKPVKGMVLKKAGKSVDLVAQTLKDEGLPAQSAEQQQQQQQQQQQPQQQQQQQQQQQHSTSSSSSSASSSAGAPAKGASVVGPANAPVQVIVEEKVTVSLNNDGGLNSMEVKGDLYLRIVDAKAARCKIALAAGDNSGYQFKTHPNISKNEFTDNNVIAPKDGAKAFPLDNNLGVLKWRFVSTDEAHAPLAVNCWPSPLGGGKTEVTLEYDLKNPRLELHNVLISIPCRGAGAAAPVVESVASGQYKYDAKKEVMLWRLPLMDASSASGTMVFVVTGVSERDLLPLEVTFSSPTTLLDLRVGSASDLDNDKASYPVRVTTSLVSDKYEVV